MNKFKLVVLAVLLSGSQIALAIPASIAAAVSSSSEASVDAFVQAAANEDVSEADLVRQLTALGIPASMIEAAVIRNINLASTSGQSACAPACAGAAHTANVSYRAASLTTVRNSFSAGTGGGGTVLAFSNTGGTGVGTTGTGGPTSGVSPR